MIYRVTAHLAFIDEDEARDFYHDCAIAITKSITLNPGQPNEERGHIYRETCHHDQYTTAPCEITAEEHTPPG